jgi:hypothetical protein
VYNKTVVSTPWLGIVNHVSPLDAPANSFADAYNVLLRKGRLWSKPKQDAYTNPPNAQAWLGARTFRDVLGNYHTVVLTKDQGYYLNGGNVYTPFTSPFSGNPDLPYAVEILNNKAYWLNGGMRLSYTEGEANFVTVAAAPTGYYMGKLASRIIVAFTIEDGQAYPNRVHWSRNGNAADWTHVSSGLADIPEVEDEITGYAVLGNYGFVFRHQGITAMVPTGLGTAPFRFENFSIGPTGVGCAVPYTLAVYGRHSVFVASDDVYYFNGGEPQPIGTQVKKQLFADLYNRAGIPQAWITSNLGRGVDYLSYWLAIPLSAEESRVWVRHQDENNWTSFKIPTKGRVTFIGNVATG